MLPFAKRRLKCVVRAVYFQEMLGTTFKVLPVVASYPQQHQMKFVVITKNKIAKSLINLNTTRNIRERDITIVNSRLNTAKVK